MIVTCVIVCVKKEAVDDFIEATVKNHRESVKEPGNLRFDILQQSDAPNMFTLYEAYKSEEDAAAHKETAHYKKWREEVADMMKEPRKGIKHKVIAPENLDGWK